MIGVCHGGKGWNVDGETDTMTADAMEEVTNLCFGGTLWELRKGVQERLDCILFGAQTRVPNRMNVVGLAGELSPKSDGMITNAACFGARISPWTQSVDTM